MEYRRVTELELEVLWNRNIAENPEDSRWIDWKQEFIDNNRSGKAVTFGVLSEGSAVGEGTLLLSPECNAIAGRRELCNNKDVANINALRIQKAYEGKGHISKLINEMEKYAVHNGISRLTIGVEAKETRNLAIYLHLGFTEFLFYQTEEDGLVLYLGKNLK